MRESGQTLLIVVLVMVVVLTVGLSVVLRSVTNVRIAVEEDNSARAFSAAESGIEQALKTGVTFSSSKTLDNNAEIKTVTVTSLSGAEFLINSGNNIEKDDATDVWLVEHNTNGSLNFSSGWQQLSSDSKLTIYWDATETECDAAAIEIVVISGSQAVPFTTRYAIDPCATRRTANKFEVPDTTNSPYTINNKFFKYRKEIPISSGSKGILVRVNPIYVKTTLGVRGCPKDTAVSDPLDAACHVLPTQGKQIESVGASGTTLRKVTFFQGYPKVPAEFFPYISFTTQ